MSQDPHLLWWRKLAERQPGFGLPDDTKVTLTIEQLRKLTAMAHRDGCKHGAYKAAKYYVGQEEKAVIEWTEFFRGLFT